MKKGDYFGYNGVASKGIDPAKDSQEAGNQPEHGE